MWQDPSTHQWTIAWRFGSETVGVEVEDFSSLEGALQKTEELLLEYEDPNWVLGQMGKKGAFKNPKRLVREHRWKGKHEPFAAQHRYWEAHYKVPSWLPFRSVGTAVDVWADDDELGPPSPTWSSRQERRLSLLHEHPGDVDDWGDPVVCPYDRCWEAKGPKLWYTLSVNREGRWGAGKRHSYPKWFGTAEEAVAYLESAALEHADPNWVLGMMGKKGAFRNPIPAVPGTTFHDGQYIGEKEPPKSWLPFQWTGGQLLWRARSPKAYYTIWYRPQGSESWSDGAGWVGDYKPDFGFYDRTPVFPTLAEVVAYLESTALEKEDPNWVLGMMGKAGAFKNPRRGRRSGGRVMTRDKPFGAPPPPGLAEEMLQRGGIDKFEYIGKGRASRGPVLIYETSRGTVGVGRVLGEETVLLVRYTGPAARKNPYRSAAIAMSAHENPRRGRGEKKNPNGWPRKAGRWVLKRAFSVDKAHYTATDPDYGEVMEIEIAPSHPMQLLQGSSRLDELGRLVGGDPAWGEWYVCFLDADPDESCTYGQQYSSKAEALQEGLVEDSVYVALSRSAWNNPRVRKNPNGGYRSAAIAMPTAAQMAYLNGEKFYDPREEQFHSVARGMFYGWAGGAAKAQRLSQAKARELLGRAIASATTGGRKEAAPKKVKGKKLAVAKQTWLKAEGAQAPTKRGIEASKQRYAGTYIASRKSPRTGEKTRDTTDLVLGRQAYEEMLSMGRQRGHFYRVVREETRRGKRYFVWPMPPGARVPGPGRASYDEATEIAGDLNRRADPYKTGQWWKAPTLPYSRKELAHWLPPAFVFTMSYDPAKAAPKKRKARRKRRTA
jgi:hypothetical protein